MDLYRVSEGPAFTLHPTIWIDPDFPRRTTEKEWAKNAGLELDAEYGHWYQYQLHFVKQTIKRSDLNEEIKNN